MNLQPTNTYRIRYKFADYPDEWETSIYCGDEILDNLSNQEIANLLGLDEEIVDFEILDWIGNSFINDCLLSISAISLLNGGNHKISDRILKDNSVGGLTKERKEFLFSYIDFVYSQLPKYNLDILSIKGKKKYSKSQLVSEERKEYRKRLLNDIRNNLECHDYQIDRDYIKIIFEYLELPYDDTKGIRSQLLKLIDPEKDYERKSALLRQLTDKDNISNLMSHLDKVFSKYQLDREKKQIKICAIISLIIDTYKYFNASLRLNYSNIKKILCDYWAIPTPQYDEARAKRYIDKDTENYIRKKGWEDRVKDFSFIECIKVKDGIWRNMGY